jgi:transposase
VKQLRKLPFELSDGKLRNLSQEGTLNPNSEAVIDELFSSGSFFDARDIVQVKYEMLRCVAVEGQSINEAIRACGFSSRQSFYTALAAFEQSGLAGLIPFKRGPKGAHKMTDEVLDFIRQTRRNNPSVQVKELTKQVRECFRLNIHQKSIERALARLQEEASA